MSCPVLSSPVKGIGKLGLDQWRASRTVVQGSQGWDGETGFGQPEEEKAEGWKGDLMVIFNYLKGCYRQDGARLLSEVCSQRRNVKWSQGAAREILNKYKKEI